MLYQNLLAAIFKAPISADITFHASLRLDELAQEHGIHCVNAVHCALKTAWGIRKIPRRILQEAAENPPRVLKFATIIQNAVLFREAMVHLIGRLSEFTWEFLEENLSDCIWDLIESKDTALDEKISNMKESLIYCTIAVDNRMVDLRSGGNSPLGSWNVSNMWRDVFLQRIRDTPAKERGTYLRKLAEGGDAYMHTESIQNLMLDNFPQIEQEPLEEDLAIMKQYAAAQVKDLVTHKSFIDIDKHNITWLTCTGVSDEELPWKSAKAKNNSLFARLMTSSLFRSIFTDRHSQLDICRTHDIIALHFVFFSLLTFNSPHGSHLTILGMPMSKIKSTISADRRFSFFLLTWDVKDLIRWVCRVGEGLLRCLWGARKFTR